MKKFLIDNEQFAQNFLEQLRTFGFGVPSKTDLEVLIINSIRNASQEFRDMDSFAQSEVLRITDSKLKSLVTREMMWLESESESQDDGEILIAYVFQCLTAIVQQGKMDEVSIYFDSPKDRRFLERAVSRFASKIPGLEASFHLGSSYITMKGSQVTFWTDLLLAKLNRTSDLEAMLRTVQKKERMEKAKGFIAEFTKEALKSAIELVVKGHTT